MKAIDTELTKFLGAEAQYYVPIIRSMVEDYEVSEEKVTADVQSLIGQMQENGFLEE